MAPLITVRPTAGCHERFLLPLEKKEKPTVRLSEALTITIDISANEADQSPFTKRGINNH